MLLSIFLILECGIMQVLDYSGFFFLWLSLRTSSCSLKPPVEGKQGRGWR
jgi:hypothetical protein